MKSITGRGGQGPARWHAIFPWVPCRGKEGGFSDLLIPSALQQALLFGVRGDYD